MCDSTTYEKWAGRKPDLSNIKTFGYRAYACIQKIHKSKLDSTAKEEIFAGYDYKDEISRRDQNNNNAGNNYKKISDDDKKQSKL